MGTCVSRQTRPDGKFRPFELHLNNSHYLCMLHRPEEDREQPETYSNSTTYFISQLIGTSTHINPPYNIQNPIIHSINHS